MNNNIKITKEQNKFILDYLDTFGVKREYALNYLQHYIYILEVMESLQVHYCFTEQLYRLCTEVKQLNISYKHFLTIIKNGEEDNFWGTYTFNRYKVIYLKANAFQCHYGVKRSSLIPGRITAKMLYQSAIKMFIPTELEQIQDTNLYWRYRFGEHHIHIFPITETDISSTSNLKLLQKNIVQFAKTLEQTSTIRLIIHSNKTVSEPIKNEIYKRINVVDYVYINVVDFKDINDKYFNGLPIV